jgi:hypothetical protein
VEGSKTERLIALLHAQRGEVARRAAQVRGSLPWIQSTNRLDRLNDQIMRLSFAGAPGATGSASVSLRDGLEVELDTRPADDAPFRRHVIDALRKAVAVDARRRQPTPSVVPAIAAAAGPTRDQVDQAQAALHERYPHAALAAVQDTPSAADEAISLRADRDGRVT